MEKRQKRWLVRVIVILTIIGLLAGSAYGLTHCTSPSGIRHGIYYRIIDEEGNISELSLTSWNIYRNEAKFHYTEFKIVEENGKIFFEKEIEEPIYADSEGQQYAARYKEPVLLRYEVKYDKKTEILTINMTIGDMLLPYSFPLEEMELAEMRFKRIGVSIG